MPPINPLILDLSQPLRHSHTLYRRDALASGGPLVSVVITVVILSILVSGASLYLLRMLWARMKLISKPGRVGGKGAAGGAGATVGEHGVPQLVKDHKEGFGGDEKSEGGTVRAVKAFKEWEDRAGGGGEVHHRKSRSRGKERARGRSYSDELWSTQVDHDAVGSSDEEDDDDGSDVGRHDGRALGTGSLKSSGSGKGTGLARHSSAKRSRFMSLGGVPAGFTPLSMHPVREHDLVDVPLRAPASHVQREEQQRESWPLRTHMVGLLGGKG